MRLDVKNSTNGYKIIDDCYNANYDSMKAALEYLNKIKSNKKIAVLGDMLELGEFSKELHEAVGKEVLKNNIDALVTVGNASKNIANIVKQDKTKEVYEFENNREAIKKIKEIANVGDAILVKASNSMNFKEIVNSL